MDIDDRGFMTDEDERRQVGRKGQARQDRDDD